MEDSEEVGNSKHAEVRKDTKNFKKSAGNLRVFCSGSQCTEGQVTPNLGVQYLNI